MKTEIMKRKEKATYERKIKLQINKNKKLHKNSHNNKIVIIKRKSKNRK